MNASPIHPEPCKRFSGKCTCTGSSSGSEGGDSKGGGGGGNNGGNQGGGCSVRDGNTCGNDAPTNDENDEQTSDPDSCDTGDPVIDSLSTMGVLEDMWVESFGSTNDIGTPQDQRQEMGGWMIKDGAGNVSFQPFPADLESSICTIQNVPPPPSGAVAVIHTHPINPNERVKVASCIKNNLDRLGINDAETRQKWLKRGLKYYTEPSKADEKYAIDAYYYDLT